jgi:hypothetical protein
MLVAPYVRDTNRRQIHISTSRVFKFGDWQSNYLDYSKRRLVPMTDVVYQDTNYYRTNAYGCQGPEIAEGLPVVGVFGDSVVHGGAGESFVHFMNVGPCQKLNAAVEGMTLPWIVDRVFELNEKTPLVAAAVHGSWHNLFYNDRGEAYWTAQLDRLNALDNLILAHFRLVADFNEDAIIHGYDEVMARIDGYVLWNGMDFTTEAGRRAGMDAINRYNAFIERYCKSRGRILIDLAPALEPKSYDDLGKAFFDFVHPRFESYQAMADIVSTALTGPLKEKGIIPG